MRTQWLRVGLLTAFKGENNRFSFATKMAKYIFCCIRHQTAVDRLRDMVGSRVRTARRVRHRVQTNNYYIFRLCFTPHACPRKPHNNNKSTPKVSTIGSRTLFRHKPVREMFTRSSGRRPASRAKSPYTSKCVRYTRILCIVIIIFSRNCPILRSCCIVCREKKKMTLYILLLH